MQLQVFALLSAFDLLTHAFSYPQSSKCSSQIEPGKPCLCENGQIMRVYDKNLLCIICQNYSFFDYKNHECRPCPAKNQNCRPSVRRSCKPCLDQESNEENYTGMYTATSTTSNPPTTITASKVEIQTATSPLMTWIIEQTSTSSSVHNITPEPTAHSPSDRTEVTGPPDDHINNRPSLSADWKGVLIILILSFAFVAVVLVIVQYKWDIWGKMRKFCCTQKERGDGEVKEPLNQNNENNSQTNFGIHA